MGASRKKQEGGALGLSDGVPRPSCHLASATTATSLLAQSVQRYWALVFSRQYNSR
jgi:hypothetical protein